MLKPGGYTYSSPPRLITVQDNTMLKPLKQVISALTCLITVQDNTMLKLSL